MNFLADIDKGTGSIIQAIEAGAEKIAQGASAFTIGFLNYLGSNAILIIPIVLMFIVLGIETIRKLIHGY